MPSVRPIGHTDAMVHPNGGPDVGDDRVSWEALAERWRLAFEAAWTSFGEGNFGIGAVLTDPRRGHEVVAVGRNLVVTGAPADLPIAGNYLAHAEMNAYASLDRFNAAGLHLSTTLQPCLMCAATGIFLSVASVEYAAADEYFDFLDDELWDGNEYTRGRRPPSAPAPIGRWTAFARLLPVAHMLASHQASRAIPAARREHPQLAELVDRGLGDALRRDASAGRSVADGFERFVASLDALG